MVGAGRGSGGDNGRPRGGCGHVVRLLRERPEVSRSTEPPRSIAASAMPIVAVLPFANQTGDAGQDYFADGVTEEVINALGRFNTLRVIGRNAVMRYGRGSPTQDEITSELGANYLVAGSVRHSGSRVRIAAQLTEAKAGTVMWSDRYDGELTDIFEFQDTIARRIAGTLAANIALVEGRRQLDRPRPDQTAFDLVLRARNRPCRVADDESPVPRADHQGDRVGPELCRRAGAAGGGAVLASDPGLGRVPDRELSRGADEARKAIALAPNDPDGYRALGRILLARAEYDQAQNALKRAIEINPSDANALAPWGAAQSFSGDIAGAIDPLQLALKLDPMLEPSYFSIWRSRTISRAGTRMPCALPSAGSGAIRFRHVQCCGGGGRCPAGTHGGGHRLCRGAPPPPAGA